MNDKELLEAIVRAMVKNTDDIMVIRSVDERGVLLTIHAHKEDMGVLIGKQGQHAKALRLIMATVGSKNNARIAVGIAEPDVPVEGNDSILE